MLEPTRAVGTQGHGDLFSQAGDGRSPHGASRCAFLGEIFCPTSKLQGTPLLSWEISHRPYPIHVSGCL